MLAVAALLAFRPAAPGRGRLALAVLLAALAALAKEAAFVLPALALLLGAVEVGALTDRRVWRLPLGMLAAQLVVLVARTIVVGGAGGYAETPFTPTRALGSAASYVLGAVTPPQLEVLHHPLLLAVPAAVLALLAWQIRRLFAAGDRRRGRVAGAGVAWFAVSLLPALNTPLDLNTANGSRVLLLPSVGLALCIAALIDRPLARRARAGLVVAAAVGLALCLWTAHDWVTASRVSDRLLSEARRLGPANGELVLLNVPEGYRTAIAFQDALDVAVNDTGRPDLAIVTCAPVHLRRETARATRFQLQPDGSFLGESSSAAPFDFPVLAAAPPATPSCHYTRAAGGTRGIGSATRVVVRPVRSLPYALAFFDGADLRRVTP
ncbi:MAG TPA: hypothetical protein VIM22_01800 [Solirubrobacteraceae bacterium]